ncbi:MAG: hypothetical protein U0X92_00770 [Anaerolineales bacterium]
MTKPDPKLVEQLVEIITHEVLSAMMEDEARGSNPGNLSLQIRLRGWVMRPHVFRCCGQCGQRGRGEIVHAGSDSQELAVAKMIDHTLLRSLMLSPNKRSLNFATKRGSTDSRPCA